MFIAALFIITPNWKQPRCPSTGECINKLWYICTTKAIAIKRNELSSHGKIENLNAYCYVKEASLKRL